MSKSTMSAHKCGMKIDKMSRKPKKTKNAISVEAVIRETCPDEDGNRKCHTHTFRAKDTHLNVEWYPEGCEHNAQALIDYYQDQVNEYAKNYTEPKPKMKGFGKDRKKVLDENGEPIMEEQKRKLRADAVVGFAGIIKPPCSVMGELSPEEQLQYFHDAMDIINELLQEGNRNCRIESFQIHFDEGLEEGEAHCHYQGLSWNKDGRLTCKNVIDQPLKGTKGFNKVFPERMRERGWNVLDTAAYVAPQFDGTETPEQKAEMRKAASNAAKQERIRRGTYQTVGLNPDQYDKVMKAKNEQKALLEDKEQAVESRELALEMNEDSFTKRSEKISEKEISLSKKTKDVEEREKTLVAKEAEVARQQSAIADAFKWMHKTRELGDKSLGDMTVWDYYQENLNGGKASSNKAANAEKTTEQMFAEMRNGISAAKERNAEEKAALEEKVSNAKVEKSDGSLNYETSTSQNKSKYSKEEFEQFMRDTENFRADLYDNCYETRSDGNKVLISDKKSLGRKMTSVVRRFLAKLNNEQLNFGLRECAIPVKESFVKNFREAYYKELDAKDATHREQVIDSVDDKYKDVQNIEAVGIR